MKGTNNALKDIVPGIKMSLGASTVASSIISAVEHTAISEPAGWKALHTAYFPQRVRRQ
jgi:hypothetical protein